MERGADRCGSSSALWRCWLTAAVLLGLISASVFGSVASTKADPDAVLAVWRLLDYIAVDYRAAVQQGQVLSPEEYAEMRQFADEVQRRIEELPAHANQTALRDGARALSRAIVRKDAPDVVAGAARELAGNLLAAHPVPISPQSPPRLDEAPALYATHCASCHGVSGHGDGVAASTLQPPPVDFHDATRQAQRSVFALYGVVTHGVDGTAMAAFRQLTEQQRWALAFHVGQLIYEDSARKRGERLWRSSSTARNVIPDLAVLTKTSPAQLGALLGDADAQAVMAYLRAHPQAVLPPAHEALAQARQDVLRSAELHAAGDARAARNLALQAYLDGFEPVEPELAARNPVLMRTIEAAMLRYRAQLQSASDPDAVAAEARRVVSLLARAEDEFRTPAMSGSSFGAGFIVLFREGLEAMLVLVTIMAYLRRTGRMQAMPYVHAGWIAALLLGVLTWAVATWLIRISGAQRELTEAVTGFAAVAVLLSVGLWMHSQSLSGRWRLYIHERVQAHLGRNQLWGLSLLAFVAVYREVFETVLFYRALWGQGTTGSLLAGIAFAALALTAIGWGLFQASARLPIPQFFRASSILIAVLAVVLAGKATAALQEAGVLQVTVWPIPAVGWLGIYPTLQTLTTQFAVLVLVLGGIAFNHRSHARAAAAVKR